MRYIFVCLVLIVAFPSTAVATEELPRPSDVGDLNCTLIEKRLDLVKSQMAVVVEQFKVYFKDKVYPKLREAQTEGKSTKLSISSSNKYAKAIAKLALAEATLEALGEACVESKDTEKVSVYE